MFKKKGKEILNIKIKNERKKKTTHLTQCKAFYGRAAKCNGMLSSETSFQEDRVLERRKRNSANIVDEDEEEDEA